MDPEEMVERVQAHYRTFWQGDVADFDTQLSDDFVDGAAPAGTPPGRDSVRQAAMAARAAFPDMAVTIEDSVVGGDIVTVRARWLGTHTGPIMGKKPSGKQIEFEGLVMWRFDDAGLIDRRWTRIDMASVLEQLEG